MLPRSKCQNKILNTIEAIMLKDQILNCENRNKWSTSDVRKHYARWRAVFPSKKMIAKENFWPFLEGVLNIAEKYEIIKFLTFDQEIQGKEYNFNVKNGESFPDFADREMQENGVLVFGRPRKALCKLSYYDEDGSIVSRKVSSPGRILERIEKHASCGSSGAVTFFESLGFLTRRSYDFLIEDGIKYVPSNLLIYTETNIWFPKIIGSKCIRVKYNNYDQDEYRDEYTDAWYDNSELALHNAPRFNQFIRDIQQLTKYYDGTWTAEYDDQDCNQNYRSQWKEDGIILDNGKPI
jgi:hypothetical protein